MLKLKRPKSPKNGFQSASCTKVTADQNGDMEYSISHIKLIVTDALHAVRNARYVNKTEYGDLVSASILVKILIEKALLAGLFTEEQLIRLPKQSMGIDFNPSKSPLEQLLMIIVILIRILTPITNDYVIENRISVYRADIGRNLRLCLRLIEQQKGNWKISFDARAYREEVENFFKSESSHQKAGTYNTN